MPDADKSGAPESSGDGGTVDRTVAMASPEAAPPSDHTERPGQGVDRTSAYAPGESVPSPAGVPAVHGSLGPYELTGFLGRGGMALVYAAVDAAGAPVALKVMEETPFIQASMLARFRREADATKLLRQHPHIVTVYDTGQEGTTHYIAMELVPGGLSLDKVLKQGTLSIAEALRVGIAVAQALAYAHSQGIVHRDMKPGNILMNQFGEPLLADFGLARVETEAELNLTMSAVAMGTPRYMSPEQTASIKNTTHLTDIYSFGLVLYEMVTGKLPYDLSGDTGMAETFQIIRHREATFPRKFRKDVSRDLCAVLLKLLEKEPERRYADMDAVVTDLEACAVGTRVTVRIPGVAERFEKQVRRHKLTALAVGLAASSLVGSWRWFSTRLAAERQRRLLPQVQAVSKSGELEMLKRRLGVGGEDLPESERLIRLGYEALGEGRAPDQAEEAFKALLIYALAPPPDHDAGDMYLAVEGAAGEPVPADSVADLRLARVARWELARVSLARGANARAAAQFAELAAELAVERQRRREVAKRALLPDSRLDLVRFEHALAVRATGDTVAAAALQRALAGDPAVTPPFAWLCGVALNEPETPVAEAVAQAVTQLPRIRALGLWLVAERVAEGEERQAILEKAVASAKTSLPWLYYHVVGPPVGTKTGKED